MKDNRTERQIQQAFFNRCNGHEGNLDPRLKEIIPVENTKGAGAGPAGFEYAAGTPDTFGHVPIENAYGHRWGGLWIEFKRPGKKPTDVQKKKHAELRALGYAVEWFDNEHKAFDCWQGYLAGEYPPF